MMANHPFAQRSLNVRDEWGREGCAICARPRGAHRQPNADTRRCNRADDLTGIDPWAALEGKPYREGNG